MNSWRLTAKAKLAALKDPQYYCNRFAQLKRAVNSGSDRFSAGWEKISGRRKSTSLVVLDDIFPHLLSAFRIAEYNHYLEKFPHAEVHSTFGNASLIGEKRSFEKVVAEYEGHYPQFKGRVIRFNPFRKTACDLFYMIFLSNVYNFLPYIERCGVPFVFTLYPGGGFRLNQEESDRKLRTVLASPFFRKVIVTQKVSYDYLLNNGFCRPDQIEFIYGGVLPSKQLQQRAHVKKLYQGDKRTFDICFVAQKYMPQGIDKGYDLFTEVAKELAAQHVDFRFHVVGPFDASDIDVAALKERIVFYGSRTTDFFPAFYAEMDLILSPNRSFVLAPGAFDGFPTGCCIEAGLCGVAVFCTDPLELNISFTDGEEFVIIPADAAAIANTVMEYFRDLPRLYLLSQECRTAFARRFDIEQQMSPRLQVLQSALDSLRQEGESAVQ